MILVHGVNHNSQHRGANYNRANADALESFVRRLCSQSRVDVITEEYSIEACHIDSVSESLCASLAMEYGLVHLYCDPTSEERKSIGIPSPDDLKRQVKAERGCKYLIGLDSDYYEQRSAQYHPQRERFWLEKLAAVKNKNVLFVCGSDHVASVCKLLEEDGWMMEVS